jgi:hypothetical protein
MGKPMKKAKRLPKKASEVEELTSDEVLEAVFGKQAQEALKKQARDEKEPKDDTPNSLPSI